jgi:hypothetical protein
MERQNLTQHFATEIPELADVYLKLADYITELAAHDNTAAQAFVHALGLTQEEDERMYECAFDIWDEKQNREVEDYLAQFGTVTRLDVDSPITFHVANTKLQSGDPDLQVKLAEIGGDQEWRTYGSGPNAITVSIEW